MALPLILLISSLAVQGAPAPAPPAAATLGQAYYLFLRGRLLESQGDTSGAVAAYKQVIDLVPTAAEPHAELAGLYAREDRADDAINEALAAIKLDPHDAEAHRILGLVQSSLADSTLEPTRQKALVTEAIGHLEQALAGGGRDLSAELALGRLYVRDQRYLKAISTLRDFLTSAPGYPEGLSLLADAYEGNHQPQDAIDLLEQMSAAQPLDVPTQVRLAGLYEDVGRWKDAAVAWGALMRASPGNSAFRLRHAAALANGGDVETARQQAAAITKDAPGDIAGWYLLSQVSRRAGDAAGAADAARHIEQIDPKDVRGPLALADAQSAQGDYRAAASALEPLVASPGDADVKNGTYAEVAASLASIYQHAGDPARAVTLLEDARRRDPSDQDLLFSLAAAYEKAERFDQAERLYRGVLAGEPDNTEALNDLGYMFADRGEHLDEAVSLISKALKVESQNSSFLDSLGWAYLKQSKLDEAREPLERAAAARPRTSVIQDHLGELYFRLKRYRDAADAWNHALSGDREGIDVAVVTKKRDRANELAGK